MSTNTFNEPSNIIHNKLIVKNFPPDFLKSDIKEFLRLYGATEVKTFKRNDAIATFENASHTMDVLRFLHQKSITGYLLSVEFVRANVQDRGATTSHIDRSTILQDDERIEKTKLNFDNFLKKINATNDKFDFAQPPPPYLKYAYPRINRDIMDAICIALETSTKFYTQVLHLMNRMNLEPPFCPEQRNLKFPTTLCNVSCQTDASEWNDAKWDDRIGTDESEIESTSSMEMDRSELLLRKKKRKKLTSNQVNKTKRIRAIIDSSKSAASAASVTKKHHIEDAFEIAERCNERSIRICAPTSVAPAVQQDTNVTIMKPPPPPPIQTVDPTGQHKQTRLSAEEMQIHPLYQNYACGEKSNKLYIKNLAKSVTEEDLENIYLKYATAGSSSSSKTTTNRRLDIRLMKTGRMKGQAFITFLDPYLDETNFAIVEQALNETNGIVFKDKVMIVMFGKKT